MIATTLHVVLVYATTTTTTTAQWIQTIATAFAAVGTVGTLGFTVRSVSRDRQARREDALIAQARQIDCWATGGEWKQHSPPSKDPLAFDVHVSNRNDVAIRNIRVTITIGSKLVGRIYFPVVAPLTEDVQNVEFDIGGGTSPLHLIVASLHLNIRFVDSGGRLWRRLWDGRLMEAEPDFGWPTGQSVPPGYDWTLPTASFASRQEQTDEV